MGRGAVLKVYIAGPMRGIKDFNFPAFKEAAAALREQGYTVFNPAERDEMEHGALPSETGDLKDIPVFNHRQAVADDCRWIALFADAIALLPGWEKSKGARAEFALADCLGLAVIYL